MKTKTLDIADVHRLRTQFDDQLANAQTHNDCEILRIEYLGRKNGRVTALLRLLKELSDSEKRVAAPAIQDLRAFVASALEKKTSTVGRATTSSTTPPDLTLPGIMPAQGHRHPISIVRQELVDLFRAMGFMILEGPELEHDFYNFEALNFPLGHPAREMQDTFFVETPIHRKKTDARHTFDTQKWLMRTHTSNMQVRIMERNTPPLRAIVAGRCFRNETTDARHEHTFYQLEGFVVDRDVTIRQLSWTLHEIFRQLFGSDATVRLRPGYFPFVEPGYEIDMSCAFCKQKGCSICKQTGWLEMGGAGMIHPNVFRAAGYRKGKYTGFAFGLGFVRIAMLRYNIPDIRMFLESDVRFLEQF